MRHDVCDFFPPEKMNEDAGDAERYILYISPSTSRPSKIRLGRTSLHVRDVSHRVEVILCRAEVSSLRRTFAISMFPTRLR